MWKYAPVNAYDKDLDNHVRSKLGMPQGIEKKILCLHCPICGMLCGSGYNGRGRLGADSTVFCHFYGKPYTYKALAEKKEINLQNILTYHLIISEKFSII